MHQLSNCLLVISVAYFVVSESYAKSLEGYSDHHHNHHSSTKKGVDMTYSVFQVMNNRITRGAGYDEDDHHKRNEVKTSSGGMIQIFQNTFPCGDNNHFTKNVDHTQHTATTDTKLRGLRDELVLMNEALKEKVDELIRFQKMFQSTTSEDLKTIKTKINIILKVGENENCDPNPCSHGGTCHIEQLNGTTNGRQCDCQYPTGGENCEINLVCENCWRMDDLVVYAFKEESVSWHEAKRRCHDRNMTMHMPNSKDLFRLTQQKLQSMYANDTESLHAFWIGLRRESKNSRFIWEDGSRVSFTGWVSDRPYSDLCVCLANSPFFNFNWDDDPCEVDPNTDWEYYYLCEKRYPEIYGIDRDLDS